MATLQTLLEGIYHDRGRLTADDVVEVAAPPESPLHPHFEWNDGRAAHQFRLEQARALIRSVHVEFTPKTAPEPQAVRAFVHAHDEHGEPTYVPTKVAMSSDITAERVLADFRSAVESLRRQYGHLSAFRQVIRDELLGDVS
jgi:hypothetical protein